MGEFTDYLGQANQVTSNVASVLRGLIDAGEAGIELALANLAPLADQLDGLFGDESDPIPEAPAGGVPVDVPVATTDADAAAQVGVVPADASSGDVAQ